MATFTNKQQTLQQALTILRRRYEPPPVTERPVLETLLYGILREGATTEQADRAFDNLQTRFYDWNEIRVSEASEIEAALENLPNAAEKASRVIGILQAVFEREFCFSLQDIGKKGLKNAIKTLQEKFEHATDFAIAWTVQRALGGHALPLDPPSIRCLKRLTVLEDTEDDVECLRASIEHLVPKTKGPLFSEGFSQVAAHYCWEDDPSCSECPLRSDCPTGQSRKSESRGARLKPR
jgi:endonuclease-3